MKNTLKTAMLLFFMLVLAGCSTNVGTKKVVENQETVVTIMGEQIEGIYSGEVEDKLPNGEGTVEADNGKYKYIGSWKNGIIEGKCAIYEDGNLLYRGNFVDGILVGLVQETVQVDANKLQYIKVGNVGFQMPQMWEYSVLNEKEAHITIPNEDNVQIIFSIADYLNVYDSKTSETIINGYLEKYGQSFLHYRIVSEDTGTDIKEYDVHLQLNNGINVRDIYSHSVFKDPILGDSATYTVTTIQDGGENDYSQAALYITRTMKNWDAIEADIREEAAKNKKQKILECIDNADWDGIEKNATRATADDIINFTHKTDIVLIEGVINNVSETTFDLWVPHNNAWHRIEEFKTNIDISDIQNGSTVQICIETWSDGSLKKSENIMAIRKLEDIPLNTEIVSAFKKSCKNIDYNAIMRNPENARGTICKAKGKVLQVIKTESYMQEFLLEMSNGNLLYIGYYKNENDDNVLEADSVTVYGTFYVTETYTTVTGVSKTVPRLACDYVDIH